MNVFILNTGRCGSTTFIKACEHITNFSCGHESLAKFSGLRRLDYAGDHIEADNRLSWLLGRLDSKYGDDAYYVHLCRDRRTTADSFSKRAGYGIMHAYTEGILMGATPDQTADEIADDYIETVEQNIRLFLADKTHTMIFNLEDAKPDFEKFWDWINAEGDKEAAMEQWDIMHNAST